MWVFGYGSLMWKTEFNFLDKKEAILEGYERDFCVITEKHRGDSNFKGLVLGLVKKENQLCKGFAYKICSSNILEVREYLKKRELLEDSYLEKFVDITINGKKEKALTYICNVNSKLYKSDLTNEEKAYIIKKAVGFSGKNIDYYLNTIYLLEKIGIKNENIFDIKNHF